MCESRLQRGEEKFSMLRDKIVSARMKMLVFYSDEDGKGSGKRTSGDVWCFFVFLRKSQRGQVKVVSTCSISISKRILSLELPGRR